MKHVFLQTDGKLGIFKGIAPAISVFLVFKIKIWVFFKGFPKNF